MTASEAAGGSATPPGTDPDTDPDTDPGVDPGVDPATGAGAVRTSVKKVALRWDGEGLRFRGRAPNGIEVPIDGDSGTGPSPMDTLLMSLASCMGSDIVHILGKSRVPLEAMTADVRGDRAGGNPRRYVRIELVFRVTGPGPADRPKLDRALALSRDTYCSVVHSLRPDIDLDFRIERT